MPFCQQDRTFVPVLWTFSSLAPSIFCSRTSAIRRKVVGANYNSFLCNPAELALVDFCFFGFVLFLQTISVFLKREHSKLLSDLLSIHIFFWKKDLGFPLCQNKKKWKKRLRISLFVKKMTTKKDLGFPSLSRKLPQKKTYDFPLRPLCLNFLFFEKSVKK